MVCSGCTGGRLVARAAATPAARWLVCIHGRAASVDAVVRMLHANMAEDKAGSGRAVPPVVRDTADIGRKGHEQYELGSPNTQATP